MKTLDQPSNSAIPPPFFSSSPRPDVLFFLRFIIPHPQTNADPDLLPPQRKGPTSKSPPPKKTTRSRQKLLRAATKKFSSREPGGGGKGRGTGGTRLQKHHFNETNSFFGEGVARTKTRSVLCKPSKLWRGGS